MEASTALAQREAAPNIFEMVERQFPPDRQEQIAEVLPISHEDPAFFPFLAIAAQLGLSPFTGELWLIPKKEKAKDGKPAREYYTPAVGRDGFLSIARRSDAYIGMRFNVVCAKDTFEVTDTGALSGPDIVHSYASLGSSGDDKPENYRGPIIGAWAVAHFTSPRPPVFYFASLKEHGKWGERQDGGRYWKGAWDYTSTMILKAAQSYVLRIGMGITGVVPADELKFGPEGEQAIEGEVLDDDPIALAEKAVDELGILPPELGHDLWLAIREANAMEPFSWAPAKINMRLKGHEDDPEYVRGVITEIQEENERRAQREAAAREASTSTSTDASTNEVMASEVSPGQEVESAGVWLHVHDISVEPDPDDPQMAGSVTMVLSDGEDGERTPTDFDGDQRVRVRTASLAG
jgi:hypothetical protein